MNCGRCSKPMNELGLTYLCPCGMVIDNFNGTCFFHVGPYKVQLFDDYGINAIMTRTIISKNLQQLHLDTELPVSVTQQQLDEIWTNNKARI